MNTSCLTLTPIVALESIVAFSPQTQLFESRPHRDAWPPLGRRTLLPWAHRFCDRFGRGHLVQFAACVRTFTPLGSGDDEPPFIDVHV